MTLHARGLLVGLLALGGVLLSGESQAGSRPAEACRPMSHLPANCGWPLHGRTRVGGAIDWRDEHGCFTSRAACRAWFNGLNRVYRMCRATGRAWRCAAAVASLSRRPSSIAPSCARATDQTSGGSAFFLHCGRAAPFYCGVCSRCTGAPRMSDQTYETILVEKRGGVGLITLNRPQALNALNTQVMWDVTGALAMLDLDAEIGCMVITGLRRLSPLAPTSRRCRASISSTRSWATVSQAGMRWAPSEARHRRCFRLCAGRRMRTGDDVRFHHCAENAQFGQPKSRSASSRALAARSVSRARWQGEGDGDVPDGPSHRCGGGGAHRSRGARRSDGKPAR